MKKYYKPCCSCNGNGKIKLAIGKRARRRYDRSLRKYQQGVLGALKPKKLIPQIDICRVCDGTGLIVSERFPEINYDLPKIAIIGGGIGGVALAVACIHRGIPFILYEKDVSFNSRSQGYGLTLQQASKAIRGLGIEELEEGIISTRHVVHDTSGKVIGEWGRRQLSHIELEKNTKPRNIHISRQSLRSKLIAQLSDAGNISWGHRLIHIKSLKDGSSRLEFECGNSIVSSKADLVVGADGIHSAVRKLALGQNDVPLNYLGCIVILGICKLTDLPKETEFNLLDGATVFQTVNGHDRIYMMPYDKNNIMWQLSFPLSEREAKVLREDGPGAMKIEGISRLKTWHTPIPEILQATDVSKISGYPVYDRNIANSDFGPKLGKITLLGDAMHPMSPFKGQGANQAILDALSLARKIGKLTDGIMQWKEKGLRKTILNDFEKEMISRTAIKVKDSQTAAQLLHSDAVLHNGDTPRGRGI